MKHCLGFHVMGVETFKDMECAGVMVETLRVLKLIYANIFISSNNVNIGQHWSTLVNIGQHWSTLVNTVA